MLFDKLPEPENLTKNCRHMFCFCIGNRMGPSKIKD